MRPLATAATLVALAASLAAAAPTDVGPSETAQHNTSGPCQPDFQGALVDIVRSGANGTDDGTAQYLVPASNPPVVGSNITTQQRVGYPFAPSFSQFSQSTGYVFKVNYGAVTSMIISCDQGGKLSVGQQGPGQDPSLFNITCSQCADPKQAPYDQNTVIGKGCDVVGNGTSGSVYGSKWDFYAHTSE